MTEIWETQNEIDRRDRLRRKYGRFNLMFIDLSGKIYRQFPELFTINGLNIFIK